MTPEEKMIYKVAYSAGEMMERTRIVKLLNLEVSEWLSHDGECDCRIKGEEGLRLIARIEGREE